MIGPKRGRAHHAVTPERRGRRDHHPKGGVGEGEASNGRVDHGGRPSCVGVTTGARTPGALPSTVPVGLRESFVLGPGPRTRPGGPTVLSDSNEDRPQDRD